MIFDTQDQGRPGHVIDWKKVIRLEVLLAFLYGVLFVAWRMGLLDRVILGIHSAFLALGLGFERAALGTTVLLMATPLMAAVAVGVAITLLRRIRGGNRTAADKEK